MRRREVQIHKVKDQVSSSRRNGSRVHSYRDSSYTDSSKFKLNCSSLRGDLNFKINFKALNTEVVV